MFKESGAGALTPTADIRNNHDNFNFNDFYRNYKTFIDYEHYLNRKQETKRKFNNILNTSSYTYQLFLGSTALKLKATNNKPSTFQNVSINKHQIKSFSPSSRKNLQFKFGMLNVPSILEQDYKMYFITLTYQDKFFKKYKDLSKVKDDLNTFSIYLNRLMSDFTFVWKLEFTEKKIPHFHLFFITKLQKDVLINKISLLWANVISRGLNKNYDIGYKTDDSVDYLLFLRSGTQVKSVYSQSHLIAYVFKYISKNTYSHFNWLGRFWGIVNRSLFSRFTSLITFTFHSSKHFFRFRRLAVSYIRSRNKRIYEFKKQISSDTKYFKYKPFFIFFNSGISLFNIKDIRYFLNLFLDIDECAGAGACAPASNRTIARRE